MGAWNASSREKFIRREIGRVPRVIVGCLGIKGLHGIEQVVPAKFQRDAFFTEVIFHGSFHQVVRSTILVLVRVLTQ